MDGGLKTRLVGLNFAARFAPAFMAASPLRPSCAGIMSSPGADRTHEPRAGPDWPAAGAIELAAYWQFAGGCVPRTPACQKG